MGLRLGQIECAREIWVLSVDVRHLAVVQNLILEGSDLLNDLLALGHCLGILQLVACLEDIVDCLGLERRRGQCLGGSETWGSVLTRMTGHRFRTESLANDRGLEVMDWAVGLISRGGKLEGAGGRRTGLGIVLHCGGRCW